MIMNEIIKIIDCGLDLFNNDFAIIFENDTISLSENFESFTLILEFIGKRILRVVIIALLFLLSCVQPGDFLHRGLIEDACVLVLSPEQ